MRHAVRGSRVHEQFCIGYAGTPGVQINLRMDRDICSHYWKPYDLERLRLLRCDEAVSKAKRLAELVWKISLTFSIPAIYASRVALFVVVCGLVRINVHNYLPVEQPIRTHTIFNLRHSCRY